MTPRSLLVALSALALGVSEAGSAQSVTFAAAAVAGRARSSIILFGIDESVAGPWFGGAVELKVGPVSVEAVGLRGTLAPTTGSGAIERDGGEVRGLVRVEPLAGLGLEAGYGIRAFSSVAGYQRWAIPSTGVRIASSLGSPALQAYARAHYVPGAYATVPAGQPSGDAKWDLGLVAEVGLTVTPERAPVFFGLNYRLERFDFPGGTAGRLEQFDALWLRAGMRLGR